METLTLWTIQTKEAWEKLNSQGFLLGSKEFVEPDYFEAFDWMKCKMIQKIGLPERNSQYPIWAWYQHVNKNNKKPDLRKSGHLPKGTSGVRIEFLKNKNDVLLSDFELWHQPLFYKGYIGKNEVESLEFEDRLINMGLEDVNFHNYPLDIKSTILNSWDNIFDLEFNDNYFTTQMEDKMIQACLWKINLSDIILVDQFIAR